MQVKSSEGTAPIGQSPRFLFIQRILEDFRGLKRIEIGLKRIEIGLNRIEIGLIIGIDSLYPLDFLRCFLFLLGAFPFRYEAFPFRFGI